MQSVVLDTNALLMPFEVRINLDLALRDLLGEARILVPGPLIGELKHLKHRYARAALMLARRYEIIPTEASGDDSVIELALKEGAYVVTNDKELRRRLRKESVPIIFLRSGRHLVLDDYLGQQS
ncbi:MAG: twitching motility protein PilT [Candidatus Methanomethylophilaceae archaeon]|jgi:rRNA-processing protein FCF1|nr:twitching motility protein PilT [Candidatus Methanomethylophilaceae archaeon]